MDPGRAVLHVVAPIEDRHSTAGLSLEQIFRLYSRYVAGIAHRLLGSEDEVDDVVQDVFLCAHRGVGQLRQQDAIKGWLATVTVRQVRRRLRFRRITRALGLTEDTDYDNVACSSASPEERALLSRLYRILETMSVDQRIAWALRYLEGHKLEEISALTGCSLATTKRRIAAAQEVIDGVFEHES